MADELDRAVATLGDRNGTWVQRRDAADWLGKIANRSLQGLSANRLDSDTDVRAAVERGLSDAKQGLGGVTGQRSKATIEGLVKAVEKPGHREIKPIDGGFEIKVTLPQDRFQRVVVEKGTAQEGGETVHIWTRCGPAQDRAMRWALKINAGFTHCGLAVIEEDGSAWFHLVHSILLETATVDEFKACVKEMAFYGDWVENKLTHADAY